MGTEESGNMGFQHRNGDNNLNFPPSGMNTNPFLVSGWDSLVSLSQSENFRGPFGNSNYSHLVHYPSDSGLVEMAPKLPFFGSGNFSELVGSFGLPSYTPNEEDGTEKTSTNGGEQKISEEGILGISPCGKWEKRVSESNSPLNRSKNSEGEQQKDTSGDCSQEEKKQKIEQNSSANMRGKQTGKQAKEKADSGEAPKENYIHVRAKRGQATNSHSLAERVRRERISERMRLLQELVPGCNKITGKAVMLDEIINYVQSLQQQVEFLSMKLATVNPELNIDIDRILSKEILHSGGSNTAIPGFVPGMSSSHSLPPGILHGALSGIPSTSPYHNLPQNLWENELQNLLQVGFDSNLSISNLGPNGGSKLEL